MDYIVYNTNTNKIVFRGRTNAQCEEYIQAQTNQEELKITVQWRSF